MFVMNAKVSKKSQTSTPTSHEGSVGVLGTTLALRLSSRAIFDLRFALRKSYGKHFDAVFSDDQINALGVFLLNCLVEGAKVTDTVSSSF